MALLAAGLVPYFPHYEYESRYLYLAFGNEIPNGEFRFGARDVATGDVDFVYMFETEGLPGTPTAHNLELAVGEWGPSHGDPPLLATGYPGPYLEERAIRVEGGPFAVRIWEGAGVQEDCKALFSALGFAVVRTTGGGQDWPSHPPPPRTPGADAPHSSAYYSWETTQYLSCAWIEYTGPLDGSGAAHGDYQTLRG